MLKKIMVVALVLLGGVSTANAFSTSNVDFFDLSAWDHATVTGGGQVFEDVCGDLDLIVAGTGNSFTTFFGGGDVQIGGNSDQLSLAFNLSAPTDIVIEFNSIDPQEIISFLSAVTPVYTHGSGLVPTLSNNLDITGNAFGISPTGVSSGFVTFEGVSSFGINYEALADQKFDGFSIGKINTVPEPGAFALLVPGLLFGLVFRRNRR